MQLPLKTVDVFTAVPFKGNPVAVVLDAEGLSLEQMQAIASWTNLSETTFVLPPGADGADYRVRIFTPGAELPFAGHPTIGTAHALLEAGRIEAKKGVLVQQCGAGLVRLGVEEGADGGRWIDFELPQPTVTALDAAQNGELEAILGAPLARPACLVDVGPRWVVAELRDANAVLGVRADLARMAQQDRQGRHTGVVIFGAHPANAAARIEVRAFAPAHGVPEDPVCGSGNGSVAAYIRHLGLTGRFGEEFVATQGAALGRAGSLRLSIAERSIRVGGRAITCIDGHLSL